jgi:hypothetical protein
VLLAIFWKSVCFRSLTTSQRVADLEIDAVSSFGV